MELNMKLLIDAHLTKLQQFTPRLDEFKFSVQTAQDSYTNHVSSIEEEKTVVNAKNEELCSKLDEVEKDICTKSRQLESERNMNNSLKNSLKSENDSYCLMKMMHNELSNKRLVLENRVRLHSKSKLSSADQALFNDRRLRATTIKNLLGLKFNFLEIEEVVEGYVFNKNCLTWFSYKLNKYSREEIMKLLWKQIKKSGKVSEWPVPSIKDRTET